MWIARYLIGRVSEDFNVSVSFDPKLYKDWNGAGCHTNYSTEDMRQGKGGMEYIEGILKLLGTQHKKHLECYGDGNE